MLTFSVIVPTFNRAHLLPETIGSLLAQTSRFDRVIVVDDGSTDGTTAMLAERFPECACIVQKRGRQQRARNTGIAAADTDWVVFCDDDDLLLPDYLPHVADLIARAPQLDAIYCNSASFRDGRIVREDTYVTAPTGFWDEMTDLGIGLLGGGIGIAVKMAAFNGILFPTGMAIRRDLFDVIGVFDERMAHVPYEDFEFTLRVLAAGQVGFLKRPLVRIRRHNTNFSAADPFTLVRGIVDMLQLCLDKHPHAQVDPLRSVLLARLRQHRPQFLYEAFRNGDWQAVRNAAVGMREQGLSIKERIKVAIAHMPEPVSNRVHRILRRLERSA